MKENDKFKYLFSHLKDEEKTNKEEVKENVIKKDDKQTKKDTA